MNYSNRLAISYYKTIATLNEEHKVYLVQHQESKKIFVKKILDVYNKNIYQYISFNHIGGIPQIIALYEEDNQLVVIENYISGSSLQEMIDRSNISMDAIYQYMTELCSILEKLHSLQPPIIHRDIKPSNIIITEYNHVMLLDFNAAKFFSESDNTDTVLLGTKGYAAPEQYGFGSSTPRTDIYALGVLMKELTSVWQAPPKVLADIIAKCIQMNPADRYQSVSELKAALLQTELRKDTKNNSPSGIRSFVPPGFRTLTPWRMILASSGYIFIFYLSLNLGVTDVSAPALWVERVTCLLMCLSIVFIGFNYLDIQRGFPLCKHRFKILHYIGIALLDIAMVVALCIVMLIIQSILP